MSSDQGVDATPIVIERTEQRYVALPITATLRDMDKVNALVPEVYEWLAQRQIAPAGPPFYRYWYKRASDGEMAIEVGVPVATPVEGNGRVIAGTIPAGSYLRYLHHGHPDQIGEKHEQNQAWAKEQGIVWNNHHEGDLEVWGGFYEVLLSDPKDVPDYNDWDIELLYMVKSDANR